MSNIKAISRSNAAICYFFHILHLNESVEKVDVINYSLILCPLMLTIV